MKRDLSRLYLYVMRYMLPRESIAVEYMQSEIINAYRRGDISNDIVAVMAEEIEEFVKTNDNAYIGGWVRVLEDITS